MGKKCPVEGYYEGVSNNTASCLSCYYSCQTCSGSSDSECLSCFGDADLDESSGDGKYCHNKNLIYKIFSSSRWYYILSIGFIVNFIIVVVLVLYICRWRAAKAGFEILGKPASLKGSRTPPVATAQSL